MISAELAELARLMRADLEQRHLRVSLAWGKDIEYGIIIRYVEEHNPRWYREFCAYYSPSRRAKMRRRNKPDTFIKRAHTLRALAELASGRCRTVYAVRLLPFVKAERKKMIKNGWRIE